MPNKISHKKRILSEQAVSKMAVEPHDIISFKYNVEDNYDKNPLVYILPAKDKDRKMTQKMKTHIYGINFNYLREYVVQEFFKETGVIRKSPEHVILKKFNLYKKAFRTYVIGEMVGVKLVSYETDSLKKRFEASLAENKPVEHKQMVNLREFSKNEIKDTIEERKIDGIKK